MSFATAATYGTKFGNKYFNNTPVWIINAQYLQNSYVHAQVI